MSLKTKLVANVVVGCGAVLAMFGCGSSRGESTATQSMRLQGSITSARLLDNARARAISSDGKHYWSYVDSAGHFTLTVKPGVSYRILVTNAQRVGPDRVTGHVVVRTPAGTSKWLGIHSGGTFDLGVLSTTGAAAAIHTKSEDAASDGVAEDDSKGDDTATHEDDNDDESGSACSSHDGTDDPTTTEDDNDVELKAEHDPAEQGHDDLDAEHEDGKEDPGEKDDDQPCAAGAGSASAGGAPAPSAPAPSAPAQLGGACHVSTDCAGTLTCAASVCSAAVIR
jgi:hypothetical protein